MTNLNLFDNSINTEKEFDIQEDLVFSITRSDRTQR
jgi:hypothetical protein